MIQLLLQVLIWFVVIEILIAKLNNHRKHLDDATITLIDQLRETDEQPDESQKDVLYLAERKLRHDLGPKRPMARPASSRAHSSRPERLRTGW